MLDYEKKLKYFDYLENGVKKRTAGFPAGKVCLYGGCRSWILWKTSIFFIWTVENFKKNPIFS